jgi:hypothetical protein
MSFISIAFVVITYFFIGYVFHKFTEPKIGSLQYLYYYQKRHQVLLLDLFLWPVTLTIFLIVFIVNFIYGLFH